MVSPLFLKRKKKKQEAVDIQQKLLLIQLGTSGGVTVSKLD